MRIRPRSGDEKALGWAKIIRQRHAHYCYARKAKAAEGDKEAQAYFEIEREAGRV